MDEYIDSITQRILGRPVIENPIKMRDIRMQPILSRLDSHPNLLEYYCNRERPLLMLDTISYHFYDSIIEIIFYGWFIVLKQLLKFPLPDYVDEETTLGKIHIHIDTRFIRITLLNRNGEKIPGRIVGNYKHKNNYGISGTDFVQISKTLWELNVCMNRR